MHWARPGQASMDTEHCSAILFSCEIRTSVISTNTEGRCTEFVVAGSARLPAVQT